MKLLFLGGNGNISWHCVETALQYGHEVWELNRNQTTGTRREIQPQVHRLIGDVRDTRAMQALLADLHFDVVCDFICYDSLQAEAAITLFKGRTGQYIFLSTESVYARSARYLPFREDTPQNTGLDAGSYIYGKIQAEQVFRNAYRDGFPVTIVRPAYTYDVIIPSPIGHNCYTAVRKYEEGYPILVPGDGSNLWTFTHARDFAGAFLHLAGNRDAVGEDYHISSDEWLTWNDVADILNDVLRRPSRKIIHIPYEDVMKIPFFTDKELLRQRMWHDIYDNTKIKFLAKQWTATTSFADGIYETLCWLNEKEIRKRINPALDRQLSQLYLQYS